MSASIMRWSDLRKLRRDSDLPAKVWIAYGCLGLALVAYLILLVSRPTGQESTPIDGWGLDAFELIVSVLCIAGGLRRRSGRAVALILGVGLASWSLGDFSLTIESLGGATPPVPSPADAFYLAFFPLAYIALVMFIGGEAKRLETSNWLDGGVAGLGAGALCAAFAFSAIQHSTGEGALTVIVNLAYPVGDVLLLLLVVGGTAVMSGRGKRAWLLLALGNTVNVVGDTANLLHPTGSLSATANAIAWPTSILLMSLAMWLPRGPGHPQVLRKPPAFVLPVLAAALGLVILFIGTLGPVNHVATTLAALTLLLVVVRTGLSIRALRALTKDRERLAVTDHLTGLGNRRYLFGVLDGLFAQAAAAPRQFAFLFIDLDGFKQINDSFGHPAGDEILRQVGERLADSLRGSDLICRIGGDEFAAVLTDAGAPQAAAAARQVIASLRAPFAIESVSAQIGASIGIALAPTDAGDSAGLMSCADVAMYRAKLASSQFALYEQDFDRAGNRLALADDLRSAIRSEQLVLHYQPQLDLRTGEIKTFEALVRWHHPELGLVPPRKFLPLAEEAGLMGELTRWVLIRALEQCAIWRDGGRALRVSVNIAAGDLVDPGFVELVSGLLSHARVPADGLVLEITETAIIKEFELCRAVVAQLRDLGVEVSIDDFGAGFTSLAYLGGLAVVELKLDRTFITPLAGEHTPRDVELVRAMIDLGHAVGLRVVAEGVEDGAMLGVLRDLGCDVIQGFFVGKPVPTHKLNLPGAISVRPAPVLA
jgi:diguanylate cyclase (GGDEF)-like protein